MPLHKRELQPWHSIKSNSLTGQLLKSHRMKTFHQVLLPPTASNPEPMLRNVSLTDVFPTLVPVLMLSQKKQTTYFQLNSMAHQDPVQVQTRVPPVPQQRQSALWYFRSWCPSCWLGSGPCPLGFFSSWFRWAINCGSCGCAVVLGKQCFSAWCSRTGTSSWRSQKSSSWSLRCWAWRGTWKWLWLLDFRLLWESTYKHTGQESKKKKKKRAVS